LSGSDFPLTSKPNLGRFSLADADRVAAYRRALEIAEANIPLVPLYQAAILYGARKEVMWTPTPNESFFLNRITWKD
jgi:peptide/nickel transport system substrate-binding protein